MNDKHQPLQRVEIKTAAGDRIRHLATWADRVPLDRLGELDAPVTALAESIGVAIYDPSRDAPDCSSGHGDDPDDGAADGGGDPPLPPAAAAYERHTSPFSVRVVKFTGAGAVKP